jgi:hypothetical protein
MDPQNGEIFDLKDWENFTKRFAPLLETTPDRIVAYSPMDHKFLHGGNYTVL